MRIPRPSRQGLVIRASVGVILLGAVIPLVNIYFATQVNAAVLTLASDISETTETTTSATFVATDTIIASGSLPAGTYLVAWGAGIGNSSSSEISTARLVRGSTEISISGSEANGGGAANNGRSPAGFWLGTLSGSEALSIEFKTSVDTTTTAAIDSKFIKAIRLDDRLVENSDYFTTGSQESNANETTDAITASMTTVKTLTKTFGSSTQDYIVMGSMEISPDSTSNSCKAQLVVDGTAITTQSGEGEDTADIYNYLATDVRSVGSGSKSITLQGQSVGTATCDFMRSRIYVFRANIFDQVVENESLGESTVASTTWTDKNSLDYTPNQNEDIMIITNQLVGSDATASPLSTRINNVTDVSIRGDTKSHAVNNVSTDYYSGMTAASFNPSAVKTIKNQFQRPTGTGTVKIKDSRLIVWSMTLKAGKKDKLTITSAVNTTQYNTSSASYVTSNNSIAASSLPAGTYLVVWGAMLANSDLNTTTSAHLLRGSTEIGLTGYETNVGRSSAGGYWIGDLSGSEALSMEYKTDSATYIAYIENQFIKAIRLDDKLVANQDYFTTGSQESNADEVTNAATGSWTTVKTLTKTFHATTSQDYILLASAEISPDNATNDCMVQTVVDGTSTVSHRAEGEDTADIYNYAAADVVTIGSGSKTITLQGQSVDGATCDFMRSRIYAFRANIFDQVVENEELSETTTSTTGTWVDKNSITYTPNQSEDVLLIMDCLMTSTGTATPGAIGIYDSTASTMYGAPMARSPNNLTNDYSAVMTAASLNFSSAKTFKGQYERFGGTLVVKVKESRLLAWSMTLKVPQMTEGSYKFFVAADPFRQWHGVGVADATTLTNSIIGTGDDAFNVVAYTPTVQTDSNGLNEVEIPNDTTSHTFKWDSLDLSTWQVQFGFRLGANSATSSGIAIFDARHASGLFYKLTLGTDDTISLINSSGAYTSNAPAITKGTIYRISMWGQAGTDSVHVRIYNPDGTLFWTRDQAMGTSNNLSYITFGRSGTVAYGPAYFSDLVVGNVASEFNEGNLTALATENSAATIANSTPFRLRSIIEQTQATLPLGSNFRLQYAEMSGTCDTAFSGETYTDVPTTGSLISYYDDYNIAHGLALDTVSGDPTSSSTVLLQHYAEMNMATNSLNALTTGYAGLWDFSLTSGASADGKTYCLRTINSNSIYLDSYSHVAQVTISSSSGPTLEQQLRGGQGIVEGVESPMQL